jgi:hypothetical protein
VNKSYDKLFNYLLIEKDLVALGLYRMPGVCDNTYPFCYTNPCSKKTIISAKDRVFVLGKDIPKDLELDLDNHMSTKA